MAAYNALGYTAAAIGNHEFDFGRHGGDAAEPADDPAARCGRGRRRRASRSSPRT